jgi:hypothetical protein
MWGLAWWPHALLTGSNPFYSHLLWGPAGVDVAGANTMPAAAIALWPVTAAFGVVVSYNVLAILAPALSALAAYLLCRRLTANNAASLVGGFLFGFSSYELSQSLGHPNLTLVFLLPVLVHLSLRRLAGELARRRFVLIVALVLGVQALLSTEILFDACLLGAAALIVGYYTAPRTLRPQVAAVAREIGVAGLIAALAVFPYLMAALAQKQLVRSGDAFGLNALNLIVPTPITRFGATAYSNVARTFEQGNLFEAGGYLSVPVVFALLAFARNGWRSRAGRLLLTMLSIALLLALGSHLQVAGSRLIPLPWIVLVRLPLFSTIAPSRFMVFADLVVAICVALWLAQSNGRRAYRWVVALVGVAMLLANSSAADSYWAGTPANPAFFTSGLYTRYLARNETVLTIPFAGTGDSLLWQAETDFYFKMPGGYLSNADDGSTRDSAAVAALYGGSELSSGTVIPILRAYLHEHQVRHIVLLPTSVPIWRPVLNHLASPPKQIGGVFLYTVSQTATTA